ncbi:MAG TPA: hypothetical protein VNW97_22835 [Candidatus Saccharimonadales bacterium]|jgi:hypothetical protein|nr:hypothetical protein [Candidatus Saccharimonadales bacterium]
MQPAAIGIRVHSGWGALVAISGKTGSEEVIERQRVRIIEPGSAGAAQPYHYAEGMELPQAKKHIANCAATSGRMALAAVSQIVKQLSERGYRVTGAAILLSSGRTLPALEKTLASHTMIHTAEGQFFRQAFRHALAELGIRVSGIVERELEERAEDVLGKVAARVQKRIAGLGHELGPPWTQDEKRAMLAAAMVLGGLL